MPRGLRVIHFGCTGWLSDAFASWLFGFLNKIGFGGSEKKKYQDTKELE
jgi:hypothetical protein